MALASRLRTSARTPAWKARTKGRNALIDESLNHQLRSGQISLVLLNVSNFKSTVSGRSFPVSRSTRAGLVLAVRAPFPRSDTMLSSQCFARLSAYAFLNFFRTLTVLALLAGAASEMALLVLNLSERVANHILDDTFFVGSPGIPRAVGGTAGFAIGHGLSCTFTLRSGVWRKTATSMEADWKFPNSHGSPGGSSV